MESPTPSQAIHQAPDATVEIREWWDYLPDMGEDARAWYMAYQKFGNGISGRTTAAVRDLQRRKLNSAWSVLENCRIDLGVIEGTAPRSVVTVVEFSYLSTLAYFYYHKAEFDEARAALKRAILIIEETLSIAPFLIPCAGQCYDYQLHLARIARAESRWREMFRQVEMGREMVYGERPLCHASWGPVHIEDICEFYRRVNPANDIEGATLKRRSDPGVVQREYHNLCIGATVVPFMVVNWCGD